MQNQSLTVEKVANILSAEIKGNAQTVIKSIMPLEEAGQNDLSFFAPTSKRNAQMMEEKAINSKAGALLVKEFEAKFKCAQIKTENPLAAVVLLAEMFFSPKKPKAEISTQASISPSAKIGKDVYIGAFSVIGEDVTIEDNCIIHPHVVIYQGAKIGKNCVIHSGAVIREFVELGENCFIQNGVVLGGDGFGYFPDAKIGHRRIPHIGNLVLAKGVDIGCNATIDRSMLGSARIDENTKIDNLVMIGHNAIIGKRTIICGAVGISGSCKIGDDVILAGGVGVADHVEIGNNVRAAARAGITSSIPEKTDVAGHPQTTASAWRKQAILISKLPEINADLKKIKKKLELE